MAKAPASGSGQCTTASKRIPAAELYAVAIECDRARFGSITELAAGERIRLKGAYEYDGRTVVEFDDGKQRDAADQAAAKSGDTISQLRVHAHMKLAIEELEEVADFAPKPAAPAWKTR